jgi:hypothetical protein
MEATAASTGAPVHYDQTVREAAAASTGAPVHYEQTVREAAAASTGAGWHLEVLKWLHNTGSPWDSHTCIAAAIGGQLRC